MSTETERRIVRWAVLGYIAYRVLKPSAQAGIGRTTGFTAPIDGSRAYTSIGTSTPFATQ